MDSNGGTVDFLLRAKRDAKVVIAFFKKTIDRNGCPYKITVDKSGSNKESLDSFNVSKERIVEIRQTKYINNIVEQDHRFIKKRTRLMIGFKNFHAARKTIYGIESIRMIPKADTQF